MTNLIIKRWFEVVDVLNEIIECSEWAPYLKIVSSLSYVLWVFYGMFYQYLPVFTRYSIFRLNRSYGRAVTSPRYCLEVLLQLTY